MKLFLRILKLGILAIVLGIVLILGVNFWVITSTQDQIYSDIDKIPNNKVAVILGTSKRTSAGTSNRYFNERISSAAKLYHEGKVRHIIVSGDNRTVYYNEPKDMFNALVEQDVPKDAITLDFAGLRTLDSIVRADSIFGQKDFTIVTQDFHCYRSLFIANYYHLNTVAFSADKGEKLSSSLAVREVLARFLAVLDLYVWDMQPTVLGEKEQIKIQ